MILRIAVSTPLRRTFDYLPPENCDVNLLQKGVRVVVPFRNRKVIGVLMEVANESQVAVCKLKKADKVIDLNPLFSPTLLKLINWASDYYHHPIGEVFSNALPKLLRDGRDIPANIKNNGEKKSECVLRGENVVLNEAQQRAVDAINREESFKVFLLEGVTGSGKTEVYLRVIAQIIAKGKQALVLVPEIGLTPQTVERFSKKLSVKVAVSHSRLTDRERMHTWIQARNGEASIVIGTRSSIFTPFANIGVIVIDEEHDQSFKQHSGFRYSARDLAVVRGKLENIPVILGSATPSLESLNNGGRKRYEVLHLPERAGIALHPSFHVIDIRSQKLYAGLSSQLIQEIRQQLQQDNQILLFLNRRGYAPVLLCHSCGQIAECRNCDAKLTLHQEPYYLHCHHCGATRPVPKSCSQCGGTKIVSVGVGTERLEEGLKKEFPEVPLLRIDRDTVIRKGVMQQMLNDVLDNKYKILIGTQMLAKGHHFPNVTMVAILDADSGLMSADFRATEAVTQLITQVAGRAGRAEKPGKVFLQTYNPANPLLLKLITSGYHDVAEDILEERLQAVLPPFSHFALIRGEAKNKTDSLAFLTELKKEAEGLCIDGVSVLGPIPSPMQKKARLYRAQLLLSSKGRPGLHYLLGQVTKKLEELRNKYKVRCSLDVDPLDMF